jgi:hypothetical protein
MPTHPTDRSDRAEGRSGRHRLGKAGCARRRARPGRFATVWPCTQHDTQHATGALAGWLLNAVIKIVTTYSMPGNRVLLLAPSPVMMRSPRRLGPYSGLLEAAWSVIRLGRGVRTGLAAPVEQPGPVTEGPTGLFDVIIAAADPHDLVAMRPTSWSRLLTSSGVLVVITHGDNTGSRYVDAAGALVAVARADGLRYLDHIVALCLPIDPAQSEVSAPVVSVRAHADVHVFAAKAGE